MLALRLVCRPAISFFLGLAVIVLAITKIPQALSSSHNFVDKESRPLLKPNLAMQAKTSESYGKLPLAFEANHGQIDSQVKFVTRTNAYSLFLTGDEAVLSLRGEKARGEKVKTDQANGGVLRMKLRDANPSAQVTGMDELAGTSNYFIGNDPAKWHTNVSTYSKVKYEGVYSGIDLVYYGNQRQLEYDFVVAPGADPNRIAFDVSGATRIHKDAHGDLLFKVGGAEIRWQKPVVYQEKDGKRLKVAARYSITKKDRVAFELAKYDPSRTLYIDPLIYSTYLGGSGDDEGRAIAVDSSGNAYVTGQTSSTDFPTKNPWQATNPGTAVAFITKINATGSAFVYSTYLGGNGVNGPDGGYGVALDSNGNAYVTGLTGSTNFPTVNALQPAYAGGASDAFVTKINAAGSTLIYSTYLGGSGVDQSTGIAVDGGDNAYVIGITTSTNFPTMNPLQPANAGNTDTFVSQINAAGSALVYSSYLGGNGYDYGSGIATDSMGNTYLIGFTNSTNFPTKNPLQSTNAGLAAFIAKLNSGSGLVYSTYLGGSNAYGNAITADSGGNAYITGVAYTCNLTSCFYNDFVDKINPTGSALVYQFSSPLNYAAGYGIVVSPAGSAYIVGVQGGNSGYASNQRTYVEKINPSATVIDSVTYIRGNGGYGGTMAAGIAKDSAGYVYITGRTRATNFPTKNPLQPAFGGNTDAFITKLDVRIVTTTTITSSPNPSTYGQAVTFTATVKPTRNGLVPPPDGETVSFKQGTTVIGTGTLSGGTATLTTSSLRTGVDRIQAVYGGDANYIPSHSAALFQTVN
jgi:hypothetical protein